MIANSKTTDALGISTTLGASEITASNVLREAADLKDLKSKDYQGSTWSEDDYFPFGAQSYIHMIHTKYLRMRNIAEGEQKTNFEALDDTLIDMAVYCCMYAAKIRRDKEYQDDFTQFEKITRGYSQDG
jgi:hypothetical protein